MALAENSFRSFRSNHFIFYNIAIDNCCIQYPRYYFREVIPNFQFSPKYFGTTVLSPYQSIAIVLYFVLGISGVSPISATLVLSPFFLRVLIRIVVQLLHWSSFLSISSNEVLRNALRPLDCISYWWVYLQGQTYRTLSPSHRWRIIRSTAHLGAALASFPAVRCPPP